MPKYMVETISMFRMRYVIDADELSHAADEVTMNDGNLKEFSQEHLDDVVSSVREIGPKEYIRMFDDDNAYLSDWTRTQKLSFINKIKYGAE